MKCVYVHCKPDGEPFYVGKGSLQRARMLVRNKFHKNVVAKYGKPLVQIVANNLTEQEATNFEILLIKKLREQGVKLTNLTNGGEGTPGVVHSLEVRQKQGAKMRIIHSDPEYKKRLSESVKKKLSTPEVKLKQKQNQLKTTSSTKFLENRRKRLAAPEAKHADQAKTIKFFTKLRVEKVSHKVFNELSKSEVKKLLPHTLTAFNIRHGFYCRSHGLPHAPVQPRSIVNNWFGENEPQIIQQLMEILYANS
jgi:hypothetical protein